VKLRPQYPLQFLVSLLAAALLWYAVGADRGEDSLVRAFRAQLTLVNIPRDLVLTSSVPDTVAVQLRGPLARAIDPTAPLEVLLDLSDARPGVNTYSISDSDIPLPPEVEVVSVEPTTISLELEQRLTRNLPIRPTVEGSPAEGFVLGDVRAVPAQISVQGPESRLTDVTAVATSPISVEGATGPVEASVQPQLNDPLVRRLTVGPIQVLVEVLPEPTPTPTPLP
jgi:YbbR domain-containing protein